MNKYEKVRDEVRLEFPGVHIGPKSESLFMRFLSVLLFFNKAFMQDFVTTIGNNIWTPASWYEWSDEVQAQVIRHERVHLRQQKRYGTLRYALLYLLWPIPVLFAMGRTRLEMEAYTETLRCCCEDYGPSFLLDDRLKSRMVKRFTSAEYGWMCVNRAFVERWYDETVECILDFHRTT